MAIAYIGIGSASTTTTSVTPVWPGSYTATAGDYALIVYYARAPTTGAIDPPSAPSGFTTLASLDNVAGYDGGFGVMAVYGKVLVGSDSLAAIVNASANASAAYVLVYTGVNTTTPEDATEVTATLGSAATWQPTGITTVTNGAEVLSLFFNPRWNFNPVGSGFVANGFTTLVSLSASTGGTPADDRSWGIARIAQATAGAQTMPTWIADNDGCGHIAFALRPAGAVSASYVAQNRIDANTSGWTLAEPTGTAQGDTVLVFGMQVGASRTITPPAGYTLIVKNETGTMGYFAFRLTRGASAPGSSWTSTIDDQLSMFALTYRGADLVTPVSTYTTNAGTGTPVTWTGLTTPAANMMVVGGMLGAGHITPSAVTLDNLRSGSVGSTYCYGYDEIVASAGATGNFTGSIPEATAWGAILVSLNASLPTPVLTQEGFRWRNDDGSETTATWLAAQDTNP